MASLLWTVAILLAVMWALGFAVNIGAWVHVLLFLAVCAVIVNMVSQATHAATSHNHS